MKTFLLSLYLSLGGGVHPVGSLLNFGVVVNNSTYHIYRSAELNIGGLKNLQKILDGQGLPFPKTVIYLNKEGYAFPFYFAINEYLAQEEYGFTFYHSFGNPRTYLDGQDPYHPTDVIDKRTILGRHARRYFDFGDGKVTGGVDNLLTILEIILDPHNQPVLFHCFGGLHRTGMVAMLIRALQDMPFDKIVAEYHHYNPYFPRQANIDFVKRFAKDPRFLALKEKWGANVKEDGK